MLTAICIWNSDCASLSGFKVTGVILWMRRVKPAYNSFLSAWLPLLLEDPPNVFWKKSNKLGIVKTCRVKGVVGLQPYQSLNYCPDTTPVSSSLQSRYWERNISVAVLDPAEERRKRLKTSWVSWGEDVSSVDWMARCILRTQARKTPPFVENKMRSKCTYP